MSNKKKLQSFSLYINDFKIITFVIWRIVKRTLNLLRKHKMMSKQDKKYKNCKKYFIDFIYIILSTQLIFVHL
jgi:hypothetical protein